jgi:hypothetical protein
MQKSMGGRIIEQLALNENFSSQKNRFLDAGADSHAVDVAFQQFKEMKERGLLSLEQKDIDRYQSFEELQAVVAEKSGVKSKTQQKKAQKSAGAELVYEDSDWKVYHITTYEASKLYGKDTAWSISSGTSDSEGRFNQYKEENTIYIAVKKQTGEKRAVLVQMDGSIVVYDEREQEAEMPSDMPERVFKFVEPSPPDVEKSQEWEDLG